MQLCNLCKSITNTISKSKEQAIFLNTGDILDGKILNFKYSMVSSLPGQAKKTIKNNDILFSEIRPKNGRYALVNVENPDDFVVSTKLMVIRCDDKILPKYLYYYLTSPKIISHLQELAESRSGTFPQITFDEIKSLNIDLPNKNFQQHIVNIIGSIDDLIESNYILIEKIKVYLKNIFDKWYLKANIKTTINDCSNNLVCGKTPSTKNQEYWGNDVPFITIPDMHNNVFITQYERKLSKEGANSQFNKFLPKNSICVSCIATPGLVSLTSENSQTNQQINSIICKNNISPFYLYLLLNSETLKQTIINLGSGGSATYNLNKNVFSNIEINILNNKDMNSFHNDVKNIFEEILILYQNNIKLQKLKQKYLNKFFG